MIKEKFSAHAFVGTYGKKDYWVLFDGAIVLPVNESHQGAEDAWNSLNVIFGREKVRCTINRTITLVRETSQCIKLSLLPASINAQELRIHTQSFYKSLDEFLREYLTGVTYDLYAVCKAVSYVAEEHIQHNMDVYGEEFESDLKRIVTMDLPVDRIDVHDIARDICSKLPTAIRSELPKSDVEAALLYTWQMMEP